VVNASWKDTRDVRGLFTGGAIYSKAAAVIAMIKDVMGDQLFFAGRGENSSN
jgi:aminopeptidase N